MWLQWFCCSKLFTSFDGCLETFQMRRLCHSLVVCLMYFSLLQSCLTDVTCSQMLYKYFIKTVRDFQITTEFCSENADRLFSIL